MPVLTDAVHATPCRHVRNVVIAFPSVADWRKFDTSPGGFMMSRYNELRGKHETRVAQILDYVAARATGRAVLADIGERPDVSVMILPFEIRPPVAGTEQLAAVTYPIGVPILRDDDPRTRPENTARARGRPGGLNADAYGTGAAVDLYFTASRISGATNVLNEILLHELVHASRFVKGFDYAVPLRSSTYGNTEEFLANVIENIFRSERGGSLRDLMGHPFTLKQFREARLGVDIRWMLGLLRKQQPTLFRALAAVRARFNPIAQHEEEEAEQRRQMDLRLPAGARQPTPLGRP